MNTKKIARIAILIALAMVLSYVESLIPVFAAVPGMKLGLTNLVVLVALIYMDAGTALLVNVLRIVLVAFTFGNLFALLYSLAGGILSFVVMFILYKTGKFGAVGISAAGGVAHNAGQIIVAAFVLETSYIWGYMPILAISGIAAGVIIGILCGLVAKRIAPVVGEG